MPGLLVGDGMQGAEGLGLVAARREMVAPEKSEKPKPAKTVRITHEALEVLLQEGGSTLRVYMALAKYADWSTGEAWPAYKELKSEFGLSNDSIANGIARLVGLGALECRRRYSNSTRYFLRGLEGLPAFTPISGELHSSENRSNGNGTPKNGELHSEKRRPVLRKTETSSPEFGVQFSENPETNEPHLTSVTENEPHKNEGGETPPSAPAASPGQDLVKLAESLEIYGNTDHQLRRRIKSLVRKLGHEKTRKLLEESPGEDILDIGKAAPSHTKARDEPPPKPLNPPDPGCDKCGGSGQRRVEHTGATIACGCRKRTAS
jgi:hypothetical protein